MDPKEGGPGGEEEKRGPQKETHRWVVERTLSWLSKCRSLLTRYNKQARYYLGLAQFACALLWFRRLLRTRADRVLR
ncbi:hypothetical protein ASNO1_02830 [Corallococcus caeni]|uniref:Transposase DDE domain-containing protein n=1 Tax=Corallococcus caeni TaxID=3082388 RepID=A0ABQ6QJ06_9BACT|nr:hypothetical protein ASNO1_02830 [Corallococcus sp. NO1]